MIDINAMIQKEIENGFGDANAQATPSGRNTQTQRCRSGFCWSWWTRWSRTACRSGWREKQKL